MNTLDFIFEVLKDAGQPLHYTDITQRILESGWQTKGSNPASAVNSRIVVEMKKGAASKFVRMGSGTYGINPDFTDETDSQTSNRPPQPLPQPPPHKKDNLFLEERVALLEDCCDRLSSELKELRDYLDSKDKWRKALDALMTELREELN